MPGLPDTFAGEVLDFVTNRNGTPVYYALLKVDPGVDAVMSSLPEITDVGYGRQPVTFTVPIASPRGTANGPLITYGPFPSGMVTGATYLALVDAQTGISGKVRYVWMLESMLQAVAGESAQLPASSTTLGW